MLLTTLPVHQLTSIALSLDLVRYYTSNQYAVTKLPLNIAEGQATS